MRKLCFRMERSERSVRSAQARACVGSDAPTCEDGEVDKASKIPRSARCRNVGKVSQCERY
jgi:hypothetical protein